MINGVYISGDMNCLLILIMRGNVYIHSKYDKVWYKSVVTKGLSTSNIQTIHNRVADK